MSTLKFNMVLNSLHVKLECHFQQSQELSRQIHASSNLVRKIQALTQPVAALSLSSLSPKLAQEALPPLNGFSSAEQADQRGTGLTGFLIKQRGSKQGWELLFPGNSCSPRAPLPKAGIIPQTGREPLPRDLFQEETPTVVEQLLSLLSGKFETFTHLVTVTAPCTPGPPPLPDLANAFREIRRASSCLLKAHCTYWPLSSPLPQRAIRSTSRGFPEGTKCHEQHRTQGHTPTHPKKVLQFPDSLFFIFCLGTVCRLTTFLKMWNVLGCSDAVGHHLYDLNSWKTNPNKVRILHFGWLGHSKPSSAPAISVMKWSGMRSSHGSRVAPVPWHVGKFPAHRTQPAAHSNTSFHGSSHLQKSPNHGNMEICT